MRGGFLILLLASGCNVVFGLEEAEDDGSGGDAGTDGGDDAGSDGAIDGRPGTIPAVVWALNVDQVRDKVVIQGYEATAEFGPPNTVCALVYTEGDCYVQDCVPGNPPQPAPNPGRVTIEGDLRLVNLDPDGLGRYSNGLPSETQPVAVLRATGLPLRWASVSRGTMTIIIADPGGRRVTCTTPAIAGSGDIPPTVLLQMPSGNASLWTYNLERSFTTAGDYEIQFIGAHAAQRNDGAWARGLVSLQ